MIVVKPVLVEESVPGTARVIKDTVETTME